MIRKLSFMITGFLLTVFVRHFLRESSRICSYQETISSLECESEPKSSLSKEEEKAIAEEKAPLGVRANSSQHIRL